LPKGVSRKWKLVLTFLLGCAFGELAADFTDWIYFEYYNKLTAEEAALVWYWMTALWYFFLFGVAYALARARIVRPEHFVYAMMFITVVGGVLSWEALSSQAPPAFLLFTLGVPVMVSLGLLWGLKRQVD